MPFDAVFLSAVTAELEKKLVGLRIDKVLQPERDTVVLAMHGKYGGRLMLCADPGHPRIQLTEQTMENPAQPPMFCMLLRKHLQGGKLLSVTQPPMERLADLCFDCTDEMGVPTQKHLILELMGRNANLILTQADGRILDCLRRVDFEMSEVRQVLPGLYYRQPPGLEKRDPFCTDGETVKALLCGAPGAGTFDEWIRNTFGGLSPLLCRELAYRVFGTVETRMEELSPASRQEAADALAAQLELLKTCEKTPVLLLRDGEPWDFACCPITQYEGYAECEVQESFSALLDRFFGEKDRAERIRQKTQNLRKTLTNLQSRARRKLELQKQELAGTQDRERKRQLGDIITANLYAISRGQARLTAVDFYDPEMREVEIPLNSAISPQQNAARYYKEYQKAKNAEKILTEQIEKGEQELGYLGSVLDELSRAESERDVQEIREELLSGGYVRDSGGRKRMKVPPSRPMRFVSSQGFPIYVGRNNQQNDQLTLKTAAKTDLWLHVQKIHGSHVIIDCSGGQPPDETVTEAMMLAVWFSQARTGQNVPVDYTPVKFVKKPAGARPGMVIYEKYRTAFATADAALVQKLRAE